MSCKRYFSCDLCGASIEQNTGIGIFHQANGAMRAVYYANESAGHHLCSGCLKGLEGMLADLDKMTEMYTKLDAAE